ncbi:MAG: hypothetical protein LBR83_07555 [Clostridiales bacterium]|jgi:predicted Mrr-cat superfamily restriction endonuclease|nr:hypothetical protein [Clostridiales bacterium]
MAKAWLVRSEYGEGAMGKFLEEGVISIDYNDLPSLNHLSVDEIKEAMKAQYPDFNERQISMRINTLVRMATEAQIDDYAVVTNKENVYFAKVTGDYVYDAEKKSDGIAHQRKVEWLKGPVLRKYIPDLIRGSLQSPISFSDISQLSDIIRKFIAAPAQEENKAVKEVKPKRNPVKEKKAKAPVKPQKAAAESPAAKEPAPVKTPDLKSFSYPIRFDQDVILQMPRDMTKDEAERLSKFVRTLYFQ